MFSELRADAERAVKRIKVHHQLEKEVSQNPVSLNAERVKLKGEMQELIKKEWFFLRRDILSWCKSAMGKETFLLKEKPVSFRVISGLPASVKVEFANQLELALTLEGFENVSADFYDIDGLERQWAREKKNTTTKFSTYKSMYAFLDCDTQEFTQSLFTLSTGAPLLASPPAGEGASDAPPNPFTPPPNSAPSFHLSLSWKTLQKNIEDELEDVKGNVSEKCSICSESKTMCTIVPCGHMCCRKCANKKTTCPFCREGYTCIVPIYRP